MARAISLRFIVIAHIFIVLSTRNVGELPFVITKIFWFNLAFLKFSQLPEVRPAIMISTRLVIDVSVVF